jgi:hypothetical protein
MPKPTADPHSHSHNRSRPPAPLPAATTLASHASRRANSYSIPRNSHRPYQSY